MKKPLSNTIPRSGIGYAVETVPTVVGEVAQRLASSVRLPVG
jgi:hypothetical protein